MMNAALAPSSRLVISRLLLIKSDDGDGSLKFSGKHALYGNPPRWHLVTPHKPAPKGAPVAAHPTAAGEHAAIAHLSAEQWDALKLADSNVNAPSFNKKLGELKGYSESGNVTAILGMGVGSNTYGGKIEKIANHLLGLHGSPHKVVAGQKAGTHAAVQGEPAAPHPSGLPEHLAPKPPREAPDAVATPAPGPAPAPLPMPEFIEGKAGVADFYKKLAQKIIDHGEAGNTSVLQDMQADGVKPKANGKASQTWLGKTANSKMLLALHAAALVHAGGGVTAAAPVAMPAPPAPEHKPFDHGELNIPGKTNSIDAELDKYKAQQATAKKSEAKAATAKTKTDKAQAKALLADLGPAMLAKYSPKFGQKELAAEFDQMVKWQPAKFIQLADKFKNEQAAAVVPPAPAATPVTESTASSGSKLAQIPWDKLTLPDTNSNAPSHNKAVAKIKAMAEAGDLSGLNAFVSTKSAAKQTYAKKQHLLAQTALAALVESGPAPSSADPLDGGPTAATPVPAAPAPSLDPHIKAGFDALSASDGAKSLKAVLPHLTDPLAQAYVQKLLGRIADSSGPEVAPAAAKTVIKQTADVFQNTQPGHNKFWSVSSHGSVMKTTYGKIGSMGQSTEKTFGSEAEAHDAAIKLINEKKAKGYEYQGNGSHDYDVSAPAGGPKDGDTKPGADGMLVFKDGHWHKAEEPASAGVAGVAIPVFADGGVWDARYAQVAQALKQQVIDHGADGFKGAVINHAGGAFTIKLAGFALKKVGANDAGLRRPAMHKFITELKAAAGKPQKVKAAKPSVVAPAAAAASGMPAVDTWQQTGPQGGSNPGGRFKDPDGVEWYCKFPASEEIAKSEVLAAKLYGLAGVAGQDAKLITKDGKVGIASRWTAVSKAGTPKKLAAVAGAQSGFAVDAWLGNWDVVGEAFDNLQVDASGKAVRIDAGGSLEYRAMGAKKPFGTKVEEINTLRDPLVNPKSAAVFGGMTKADLTASVAKVLAISDVAIRAMVNQHGPGDASAKKQLADTLIARKADLAAQYPAAVKAKKKVVFDPGQVSAPPSFTNWGGSGKSGPSSKEFLNTANEAAVQSIFAAAKTGEIAAVQSLTANVYGKETGAVTGVAKVLEHPSQHVKGYAQQAINEIHAQLNPPKKFRFDGGHPLHSLNAAYPAHTGAPADAVQKLAKFIVLGEPGVINLSDLGLPDKLKHSSVGGSLTQATFSPQAKAAIAKMPATQKQAVKSYTGSAYHAMNGSLWTGNPSGASKSAGEALHTLGHDITPGTVLSRKISLHGADLELMLKSAGKVLQEPAIMSTSIRPSSWHGNVHLKLHAGPGVKGLWVGPGSLPGGGALSSNAGEDELILPPGTRLLILSVKSGGGDPDGFGGSGGLVVEAVILPTI